MIIVTSPILRQFLLSAVLFLLSHMMAVHEFPFLLIARSRLKVCPTYIANTNTRYFPSSLVYRPLRPNSHELKVKLFKYPDYNRINLTFCQLS